MKKTRPRDKGFDPDRLARIASWQERFVAERKYPGSTILMARGGEEVYFNAVGHRNIEAGLPFTRDTVARIYSMTKPITSVGIMMLVEEGLFHLDAPLSEFLPEYTDMQALVPDAERIDQTEPCPTPTLHQLATHTSGFTYHFNPGLVAQAMLKKKFMFGSSQGSLDKMAGDLSGLPLAFTPGSRWEYSVGIDLLGRVIEVVSGQPLDEFFRKRIFDPLGMSETGFRPRDGTGDRFAALYTNLAGDTIALGTGSVGADSLRLFDAPGSSPFEKTTLFSGGGGLVGTIDDYMAFLEMLRTGGSGKDGRLLSPQTIGFMTRNHLAGDIASMGPDSFAEQPMHGVGFGIGGAVLLEPGIAGTPGSIGDFSWGGVASTFFWVDPVLDMTVVFFTQLMPSSAYPSRPHLKAVVHGAIAA